jgi:hypothetical protein
MGTPFIALQIGVALERAGVDGYLDVSFVDSSHGWETTAAANAWTAGTHGQGRVAVGIGRARRSLYFVIVALPPSVGRDELPDSLRRAMTVRGVEPRPDAHERGAWHTGIIRSHTEAIVIARAITTLCRCPSALLAVDAN